MGAFYSFIKGCRRTCLAAGAVGVACSFVSFSAIADELFDLDIGTWTSTQTYDANLARKLVPEKPSSSQSDVKLPNQGRESPAEPLAAPERTSLRDPSPPPPLFKTPPMPSLNKQYTLEVGTTQDDGEKNKLLLLAPGNLSSVGPPDKDWRPLTERLNITSPKAEDGVQDHPLNVRMTYLPSRAVVPTPSVQGESAVKRGHELLRKLAAQKKRPKPKTREEEEACKALDAYKQRQLDALQGDRETLKALQEAIRSLGLTKELEFITEQGSTLSSSSGGVSVSLPVTGGHETKMTPASQ
ncbi:MAG: hypothetical protein PHE27_04700 [Alphaproteobacteria bacterium]|nr:hypothetical protein [Alphaproteobacteria bacterium]